MEIEENEHQMEERSLSIASVEEKNVEQYLKPELHCCIYRIPQFIGKSNKAAYTPKLISLGPLHCCNEELMRMESHKKRYRTKFEERLGPRSSEVVQKFENYIKEEEQNIRAYYSVTSNLQGPEFAELILGDVIFILELFLMDYRGEIDFLLESPIDYYVLVDLLMLENQLPYSLLNHLYSIAFPSSGGNPRFYSLCIAYFNELPYIRDVSAFSAGQPQFKHFTDFLRCVLLMEAELALKSGDYLFDLPCATKLKKSGLEFKGRKDQCLLDIQFVETRKYVKWLRWFEANELQIPTLIIDDHTEILLRNLMAWEMFQYSRETHICSYVQLMDSLIDTKEDVDLLVEKGIIVNFLGDGEAIAKMFNRLCLNVTVSRSCYYDTVEKMKAHYKNPWNHAKATLKIVYFGNLWKGTATVAATFLLIFTLMQTICSVIQVRQGYIK